MSGGEGLAGSAETAVSTGTEGPKRDYRREEAQDKYCHFCQHIKLNMLACYSPACSHRYCIHCLSVHLGEDTKPGTSLAFDAPGRWTCPTCRSCCCCSSAECLRTHRHCKAFRYRVRRADAASMRADAAHALVALAAAPSPASPAPTPTGPS